MTRLQSRCAACLLALLLVAASPLFAGDRAVTKKVDPIYPPLARQMQLHGTVRVQVVVAPDGSVKDTEVLGGNPLLAKAATDAIRQWRYQPGKDETKDVVEFSFNTGN